MSTRFEVARLEFLGGLELARCTEVENKKFLGGQNA
jgi:hypothetical protein